MKKSQVSVFIIIGALILITAVLVTYIITSDIDDMFRSETSRAFDDVTPAELIPFKRYVEQCVDTVLLRGLRRAGSQGGFIYPQELGKTFNYANPTEADGITVFPSGDLFVPYWVHIAGDNECDIIAGGCEKIFQPPPLEGNVPGSIQSQLELYVSRNIDTCIRNQEQLEPSGVFYERVGSPEVEIIFTNNDVRAILTYPMAVESGDSFLEIEKFTGFVDLPFVEYYENALYLATIIDQSKVFERGTLALISLYSGMDSNKLPPMAGGDAEFSSTVFWVAELVKLKLRDLLVQNIQLFTVQDSRNFNPVDTFESADYYTLKEQTFRNFILPGPSTISSYNVDFAYNDWSPYLRLNDDGDSVLRPETFSVDWFPFFGVNRIRTMYSISYPVMTTISNPDDLGGSGFHFTFASEVNIRNNAAMEQDYIPFDYSIFREISPGNTFLCDVDMRTSEPVSFTVINGETGQPESEVFLNFACGDEVCSIGEIGEDGVFEGSLPVCAGGRLQLLKPDFETAFLKINPSIDFPIELGNIPFEPYRLVNVTVSRLLVTKDPSVKYWNELEDDPNPWSLQTSPRPLDSRQQVMIQLERIRDEYTYPLIEKETFTTFAAFSGSNPVAEMQLLPGYYVGTITSVLEAPVEFPPDERCYTYQELRDLYEILAFLPYMILPGFNELTNALGLSPLLGDEKKCFDIPEETEILNPYPGGRTEFSEETKIIQIRKANLDSASTIEFREIFIDIPGVPANMRVIEDLSEISDTNEYARQHQNLLGPIYR